MRGRILELSYIYIYICVMSSFSSTLSYHNLPGDERAPFMRVTQKRNEIKRGVINRPVRIKTGRLRARARRRGKVANESISRAPPDQSVTIYKTLSPQCSVLLFSSPLAVSRVSPSLALLLALPSRYSGSCAPRAR